MMALGENMKIDKLIPERKMIRRELSTEADIILTSNNVEISQESHKYTEGISSEKVADYDQKHLEPIEIKNIKVVFTPSRRKATRRISILIEGEFTVNNVSLVKDRVEDVFYNYDYVDVVLKNITLIDLTVIQLFHVLKSLYDGKDKHIFIDAELSKNDKLLFYKCGLADLFSSNKVKN